MRKRIAAAVVCISLVGGTRKDLPPMFGRGGRTEPVQLTVQNQRFVFTQFSGAPQVFLTRSQLIDEMVSAGFTVDPDLSLRELNVPPAGVAQISGPPAIFEAAFRFQGV